MAIPVMRAIECALNRDILREKEQDALYWAFDTKELLKGSLRERMEAYKLAVDANIMQIDEIRFEEDLPALGLNWIKLGLDDVLYDPKTNTVYTPNTNQTAVMGKLQLPGTQDPPKGEYPPLQERADGGMIEERGNPNHDPTNGQFTSCGGAGSKGPGFHKKTLVLPKKEYGHVMHEISSHYDAKYRGKKRGVIYLPGGKYSFEIRGFGDYNIYAKK